MVRQLGVAAACLLLAVGTALAADPIKVDLKTAKFDPENGELLGYSESDSRLFLYAPGKATVEVELPADGEYTITVEASCDEAQNEKAKFKLTVGDEVVKDSFELATTEAKEYTFTAKLKKGKQKLTVAFLNDAYKENEFDRNLYVQSIRLEPKK